MFSLSSSRLSALAAGAGLALSGCSAPPPLADIQEVAPNAIARVPDWNASVRMYEASKGHWAVAVAGGEGVALLEASPPIEGSKVVFGERVRIPEWNTSVVMVKMQNDEWYVIAAGGSGVAITKAQGSYDSQRRPTFEAPVTLKDWNVTSRNITLQDGHSYTVIAGGTGVSLQPMKPR